MRKCIYVHTTDNSRRGFWLRLQIWGMLVGCITILARWFKPFHTGLRRWLWGHIMGLQWIFGVWVVWHLSWWLGRCCSRRLRMRVICWRSTTRLDRWRVMWGNTQNNINLYSRSVIWLWRRCLRTSTKMIEEGTKLREDSVIFCGQCWKSNHTRGQQQSNCWPIHGWMEGT